MNAKEKLEAIMLEHANKSVTVSAIRSFMKKSKNGFKVVLFGCGNQGQVMLRTLKALNIKVSFYCDNNCEFWGKSIRGLKCISPAELSRIKNVVVCISSNYINEIYCQLKSMGINDVFAFGEFTAQLTLNDINNVIRNMEKLVQVLDFLNDEFSKQVLVAGISQWFNGILQFPRELISENQFFDKDIYKIGHNEIFVDAGAYNGDTVDLFCKATDNLFEKIYAFELNPFNFKNLIAHISEKPINKKVVCINKGIGNENGKVYYSNDDTASQICLKAESSLPGEICRLDDVIEYATLIKMDIEGAELEALKGAEQLIKKCKPKLAICIYHKPQDFFEIPLYIKSIVPEYQLAVRHYTTVETETVLYAFL